MRTLAPLLLLATGCITEPGLFVEKTGKGDGRVVSDPVGIDCGEKCGALANGPVTLVATPDANSVFEGWDGAGCSGIEPCTVDIATETTVEAKFAVVYQSLTITPDPHGHVNSLNIDCGDICTADYPAGMTVRLTATPATDYLFLAWSDDNITNPRLFTVNESVTLAAKYEMRSSLTVSFQGLGTGRVTSSPPGVDCGVGFYQCSVPFRAGTLVTLNAAPTPGSTFTGWQGCTQITGTPSSCTVDVTGPLIVFPTFTKP